MGNKRRYQISKQQRGKRKKDALKIRKANAKKNKPAKAEEKPAVETVNPQTQQS